MNFCRFNSFGCFVRIVFADMARILPAEKRKKNHEKLLYLRKMVCISRQENHFYVNAYIN